MNRREKILLLAGGGLLGTFILYLLLNGLFLSPLKKLHERRDVLTDEIETIQDQKDRHDRVASRLPDLLEGTFGSDVNVEITRVLQKSSGRLIFGKLRS